MNDDLTPNLYDYSKMIKSPDEMGINDNGTWYAVMYNLDAMGSYVQALSTGKREIIMMHLRLLEQMVARWSIRWQIFKYWWCTTDKNGNKQDRYSYE